MKFLNPTSSQPFPASFLIPSSFYSHLHAYENGTDRVFRNVGKKTPDAGVLPKRKHTTTLFSFSALWESNSYLEGITGDTP